MPKAKELWHSTIGWKGVLRLSSPPHHFLKFFKDSENSGESVKTCISLADSDAMPQFLTAAAILPRLLSPTFRETRYGLGCQLRMLLAVLDHGSGREANQNHFKIGIEESQPSFAVPPSPRL